MRRQTQAIHGFFVARGEWTSLPRRSAERAIATKPLTLESDRHDCRRIQEDSHGSRGGGADSGLSSSVRAERIVWRQDSEVFSSAVRPANPATFRYKQTPRVHHGQAMRSNTTARGDRVEFFDDARLRRDSGDDIAGIHFLRRKAGALHGEVLGQRFRNEPRGRVRRTIVPKKPGARRFVRARSRGSALGAVSGATRMSQLACRRP